jgi:hypothetical protein
MKELYKQLTETINSLPGIQISGDNLSNSFDKIKSSWGGACLFFWSDEKDTEGLFFLTRCIDTRYWEYGHLWRIEITVGDQIHTNGDRPITYNIYRPFIENETEEQIDKEIKSLIDNMNYHFHHDNFMSGYNMDRSRYGFWITNPEGALTECKREDKLKSILQ